MDFTLNDYHRDISDEELLDDVKRIANKQSKGSISQKEYKMGGGKFGLNTYRRHFGSWNLVLELCGLEANVYQLAAAKSGHKYQCVDNEELLKDIKRVGAILRKDSFSSNEYNTYGEYSSSTCFKKFSSWNNALTAAGLKPYVQVNGNRLNDIEMLKEIERIWIKLGRQPTTSDIKDGASNDVCSKGWM
jgi:hypothetical protein